MDLFHNGDLCTITSPSNLVSKLSHTKEYIKRSPLWKRSIGTIVINYYISHELHQHKYLCNLLKFVPLDNSLKEQQTNKQTNWCAEGHRFNSWWGLRFFFLLRSWHVDYTFYQIIIAQKPWTSLISKIQPVVYYQCCVLVGWASTRLYRKIPKISPGAYIFQRPFLRGLFLEELIYRGKFASQNRLG